MRAVTNPDVGSRHVHPAERLVRHADDRVAHVAQGDDFADWIAMLTKCAARERSADHRDIRWRVEIVLVRRKRPSDRHANAVSIGSNPERRVGEARDEGIAAAESPTSNPTADIRRTRARSPSASRIWRNSGYENHTPTGVLISGPRRHERVVRVESPDVLRFGDARRWPEQQRIDERENRAVRTDRQRQRADDRRGESRLAPDRAHRVPDVRADDVHKPLQARLMAHGILWLAVVRFAAVLEARTLQTPPEGLAQPLSLILVSKGRHEEERPVALSERHARRARTQDAVLDADARVRDHQLARDRAPTAASSSTTPRCCRRFIVWKSANGSPPSGA